jgi:hypothetical protein
MGSDSKAVVKELREARNDYNAARDKIDLVVNELVKLMAALEERAKDTADTKRLDVLAQRIQSWNDTVEGA